MTRFGNEHFPLETRDESISGKFSPPTAMPLTSIPQGWQCPVCKKVHAPWVAGCDCDVNKPISNATESLSWKYTPVPIADMPNVGSMTIGAKDE